jgi:sterol desaturase/sphingolipid hydroxylase (fatty acid hydroxylase superfamily)
MALFALEHSRKAYALDFGLYGVAALVLVTSVLTLNLQSLAPHQALRSLAWVAAGLFSWTWIEYAVHRFLLHGLAPFSTWHAQHHQRPTALIYSPTVFNAALIGGLVFWPAWALGGATTACAFSLGVVLGNLAYSVTHHATHHWRARSGWLLKRKRWHALHHQNSSAPVCFGVTTAFWDQLLGSSGRTSYTQRDHV